MSRVRLLTAGESHGKAVLAIVEGLPAGMPLGTDTIDEKLRRRQKGYGRGGRMDIERDRVDILSGVRHGNTIGSPIALIVSNLDWDNWKSVMSAEKVLASEEGKFTTPRPGHADLSGGMKYGTKDLRNILERASARETAARVAAGAVFAEFLSHFGVMIAGMVEEIGGIESQTPDKIDRQVIDRAESSPFRCPDPEAEKKFRERVDKAAGSGDTVGGIFVVRASGLAPGLGSYTHWDRRLDSRLSAAVMSIPGIKGVEIGLGFRGSHLDGSSFHDEITFMDKDENGLCRYHRETNNAGGLEGGVTTGEELVVRAMMKPIPTTVKPLRTVDIASGQAAESHRERSDVCAVPAAAVVGEAMCAYVLADEYLNKFGGDTIEDSRAAFDHYIGRLRKY